MLAHGIGERADLPLEVWMFALGLGVALSISFLGLGLFWNSARLTSHSTGKQLVGRRVTKPLYFIARFLGFGLFVLALWAGLFGNTWPGSNLLPVTLYVTAWVGAQIFGGLLGDAWRLFNPVATLSETFAGIRSFIANSLGGRKDTELLETEPETKSGQDLIGARGLLPIAVVIGLFFDEILRAQVPDQSYLRAFVWAPTAALLITFVAGSISLFPGQPQLRKLLAQVGDLGHWPAAVGLTLFLFYELSHPQGVEPRVLASLLMVHAVTIIVTALLWGSDWVLTNEPFTALFEAISNMAPLYFDGTHLAVRWPLTGLSQMAIRPGTIALLMVAIGGTSFDGFSESPLGRSLFSGLNDWGLAYAELVTMIVSIGFVALLYWAGIFWTAAFANADFKTTWNNFGSSLVPIVFGYAFAHYFRLFSDEIQSFYFRLSDPLGTGWSLADPFGTGSNIFDPFGQGWQFLNTQGGAIAEIGVNVVAWTQVGAMLIGHVGAVIVSHDKALELGERSATGAAKGSTDSALTGQLGMAVVMVAYSTLGLGLLLTA